MSHLSMETLLSILRDGEQRVRVDGDYTHKKSGTLYTVAGLVFKEEDMSLMVTYYDGYFADITFARPIDEFLEKFE